MRLRRLACVLALAWVAASACSLHQPPSSAATSVRTGPVGSPLAPATGVLDAEVAMPAGFPSDFPIYPRARLTAAAPFASSGQTAWGMEWESLDPLASIETYYQRQLGKGDWTFAVSDPAERHWSAAIGRKSDSRVQGQLSVNGESNMARILLSLIYPG